MHPASEHLAASSNYMTHEADLRDHCTDSPHRAMIYEHLRINSTEKVLLTRK